MIITDEIYIKNKQNSKDRTMYEVFGNILPNTVVYCNSLEGLERSIKKRLKHYLIDSVKDSNMGNKLELIEKVVDRKKYSNFNKNYNGWLYTLVKIEINESEVV